MYGNFKYDECNRFAHFAYVNVFTYHLVGTNTTEARRGGGPLAPALHLAYYDTCFILKIRADILTFDFFFLNTILNAINAADYPSVINQ